MSGRHFRIWLLLAILCPLALLAQKKDLVRYGRICGFVYDQNTGDPLPGANAFVENTDLGGACDVDGFFLILNVPVGEHSLRIEFVGYKEKIVKNVLVDSSIVDTLHIKLEEGEIAGSWETLFIFPEEMLTLPLKLNLMQSAGWALANGSGPVFQPPDAGFRNQPMVLAGFNIDDVPHRNTLTGEWNWAIPEMLIDDIVYTNKFAVQDESGYGNIALESDAPYLTIPTIIIRGGSSEWLDGDNVNSASASASGRFNLDKVFLGWHSAVEYRAADDFWQRFGGLDKASSLNEAIPSGKIAPEQNSHILKYAGSLMISTRLHWNASIGINGQRLKTRGYDHSFLKSNSIHQPRSENRFNNLSIQSSYVFSVKTFVNAVAWFQRQNYKRGDGLWFDDLSAYNRNNTLQPPASADSLGSFAKNGTVFNRFEKYDLETFGGRIEWTSQINRHHRINLSGQFSRQKIRYFDIAPYALGYHSANIDSAFIDSLYDYAALHPYGYGFDVAGNEIDGDRRFFDLFRDDYGVLQPYNRFYMFAPPGPLQASLYLQDFVETNHLRLRIGLRWQYFDANSLRIRDPFNVFQIGPFGNGGWPPEVIKLTDFEAAPLQRYFSPRVKVNLNTGDNGFLFGSAGVHRQWGRLIDIYPAWAAFKQLESAEFTRPLPVGDVTPISNYYLEAGYVFAHWKSPLTGSLQLFHQRLRHLPAVVNLNYIQHQDFDVPRRAVYPAIINAQRVNIDGITADLTFRPWDPFHARLDYTFSRARQLAIDENDIDERYILAGQAGVNTRAGNYIHENRHIAHGTLQFSLNEGKGFRIGGWHPLQKTILAFSCKYQGGRPYWITGDTLRAGMQQRLPELPGSEFRQERGPDYLRFDLYLQKRFDLAPLKTHLFLQIQNLFNRKNILQLHPATGSPDNSGWLESAEGRAAIESQPESRREAFINDYKALESNPTFFDIPRLIRLGFQVAL